MLRQIGFVLRVVKSVGLQRELFIEDKIQLSPEGQSRNSLAQWYNQQKPFAKPICEESTSVFVAYSRKIVQVSFCPCRDVVSVRDVGTYCPSHAKLHDP